MNNQKVSDPNEYKVIDFTNHEDFGFTPEMGCMYDGRPIFGITGAPSINPGESIKLPYYVAQRLATNLAKVVMTRRAPAVDPAGIPTGVPLWNTDGLEKLKNSYLTELYIEEKPTARTETDILMAKVEALNKMVEGLVTAKAPETPSSAVIDTKTGYQDKAEVIAELTKRGIKFDARQNKDNLTKLLA